MLRNVISCFDGISCGRLALDRAKISFKNYYAYEIDTYAINISQSNFKDIKQLGDINTWKNKDIKNVDLIMAGSPCQGFSRAGLKLNFEDTRSKLFFTFIDLLRYYNPKYFFLENVKMKPEWQEIISDYISVKPVEINSSLFSAQSRGRLYWTNIEFDKNIQDKNILFKDILQKPSEVDTKYNLSKKVLSKIENIDNLQNCGTGSYKRAAKDRDKAVAILARDYKGVPGLNDFNLACQNGIVRKLTPIEYERLQTLPDNYTKCVSDTQRYKALGNAWTVDVIAHILKGIV